MKNQNKGVIPMKKIIIFILGLFMMLSVVSCSKKSEEELVRDELKSGVWTSDASSSSGSVVIEYEFFDSTYTAKTIINGRTFATRTDSYEIIDGEIILHFSSGEETIFYYEIRNGKAVIDMRNFVKK